MNGIIRGCTVSVVFLYCILSAVVGQRTQIYHDPERSLKEGIELFQKEKYSAASVKFEEFFAVDHPQANYAISEARYYQAACAVELFHNNAEYLVKKFVEEYPESPKTVQAWFLLGKLYFRKKDYTEAITAFQKSDVYLLTRDEFFEYYYKLAYSELMEERLDDAQKHFSEIKDRKSIYQVPATYYFGYIAYRKGNYEVALQHFLAIESDKNFSRVVPLFIAQIYYYQKKYDQAVTYADPIADTIKGKNRDEIYRLLAESYYELKNNEKSRYWYNVLTSANYTLDRTGYYRAGVVNYHTQHYNEAIDLLQNATQEQDAMSQTAYYYIANSYILTGRKQNAMSSLQSAYTMEFEPQIRQEAMYNYAKLAYELGFNPYNEAVDALENYLNTFPNASNRDDAYTLLVEIYLNTKNYKAALESLSRIKNKNTALKIAEQRIYYFRGVELFNNYEYEEAIRHFNEAINRNYEAQVAAEARFWKADAYYRQKMYSASEQTWLELLSATGARELNDYYLAYYNLGYARFKQRKFGAALTDYRMYADGGTDKKRVNDAYLRIGDCYFMEKNLPQALDFYNKAIELDLLQTDYALFQKGIILGLQQNNLQKFNTLKQADEKFPNSVYRDEIRYELGVTSIRLNKDEEAVRYFEDIVKNGNQSKFLPKAYLQLGQLYYENKLYSEALGWYKRVISEFPNTTDAKSALENVKSISVQTGDIDGLTAYLNSLDNVDINENSLDSLSYSAADNLYEKGNCEKAISAFGKYIRSFPRGAFLVQAHFFKADCHYTRQEWDSALVSYQYITGRNKTEFTETALARAGKITFSRKQYEDAIRFYSQLEQFAELPENKKAAQNGLMRSYFATGKYTDAAKYAQMVMSSEKTDAQQIEQCIYIIATSQYFSGNLDQALASYKELKTNTGSEAYVEAQYRIGYIYYQKKNYTQAEKHIFKSVNNMGAYPVWLGKSFILLGDVYREQKKYADARSVYNSVLEKMEDEELLGIANKRLEALDALMNGPSNKTDYSGEEIDIK